MREHISPHDIANEVRMKRTQHSGSFLIVEGGSDALFFDCWISSGDCEVVVAHGRENAAGAIKLLVNEGFPGVLAVLDSDFCVIEGGTAGASSVLTDAHDLETMLIQSPALDKVVTELGSKSKLVAMKGDVRSLLTGAALEIGALRLLNHRESLCLNFEELSFRKFVDVNSLSLNVKELVRILVARSHVTGIKEAEILKKVKVIKGENLDSWHLCCGHDLVEILGIALAKILGTANAHSIKRETLEKDLRLAYEFAFLQATSVYSSIRKWENSNRPFVVFP
jgi:hypothetical protein